MLPTIDRAPRRSRYSSATWYPAVRLAGLRRRRVEPDAGLRAATVPVASSSATRVSPRSTLTSTCFFNCLSVLYLKLGAAPESGAEFSAYGPRLTRGSGTTTPTLDACQHSTS